MYSKTGKHHLKTIHDLKKKALLTIRLKECQT